MLAGDQLIAEGREGGATSAATDGFPSGQPSAFRSRVQATVPRRGQVDVPHAGRAVDVACDGTGVGRGLLGSRRLGAHRRPVRAGARPCNGRARGRTPGHGQGDRAANRRARVATTRRGGTDSASSRRLHDRIPRWVPEHAAGLVGGRHHDRQRRPVHRVRPHRRVRRDPRHGRDRAGARGDRCAPRPRRSRTLEPRGRLGHAGVSLRRVRRMGSARAVRRRGPHRSTAGALLRQHDSRPRMSSRRALRARRSPRTGFDRLDGVRQHRRSSAWRSSPQPRRGDGTVEMRHRTPATASDRPRREPGAPHRGGEDSECFRDRRGAPARPRHRSRRA